MKDKKRKIERLEKREDKLVSKGYKAVDEGRDRKADRLLKRAARTENKVIKAKEGVYKYGGKTGKPKKTTRKK
jgi:phage shock protein A